MNLSKTIKCGLVGALVALAMACTPMSNNKVLRTDWNQKYPASAQEMNLVGGVKSIRVNTFLPVMQGEKVIKGKQKPMDFMWYAYTGNYAVKFMDDGRLAHRIVYKDNGKVWLKREYIYAASGEWTGAMDWNDKQKPAGKMSVSYDNGKMMVATMKGAMEGDDWEVSFKYLPNDTIAYSISYYEMGTKYKELIKENLVRELWSRDADAGEVTKAHHVYSYNGRGDLIEDAATYQSIYPMAPETVGPTKKVSKTYMYSYDKKGNWTTRVDYVDGKAIAVLERSIVY